MDADLILLKSIGILRIPLLPDIAIEGSWEEMNALGLGSFSHSADYSNTYYHFDFSHIRRKNPLYDGKVYIDFVKYQTMESEQRDVIRQSNF